MQRLYFVCFWCTLQHNRHLLGWGKEKKITKCAICIRTFSKLKFIKELLYFPLIKNVTFMYVVPSSCFSLQNAVILLRYFWISEDGEVLDCNSSASTGLQSNGFCLLMLLAQLTLVVEVKKWVLLIFFSIFSSFLDCLSFTLALPDYSFFDYANYLRRIFWERLF